MSLSKKYGITDETIKAMVKDGILPCSVYKCDEILIQYESKIQAGIPKFEAVKLTSEQTKVSVQWVYEIIRRFQ